MTAGEFNDLGDFCFSDLISKNATNPHTMSMDMQHDLYRLIPGFAEKVLEDEHYKLHGGIVIV